MKDSRNKQIVSFKKHTILYSAWDVNHPFSEESLQPISQFVVSQLSVLIFK